MFRLLIGNAESIPSPSGVLFETTGEHLGVTTDTAYWLISTYWPIVLYVVGIILGVRIVLMIINLISRGVESAYDRLRSRLSLPDDVEAPPDPGHTLYPDEDYQDDDDLFDDRGLFDF